MKPKSLRFDDIEFYSENALSDYILGVREATKLATPISGRNERILSAVLHAQPNADDKNAGREISHFEVRHGKSGRRTFVVVFDDDSLLEFTWKLAVAALFGPK